MKGDEERTDLLPEETLPSREVRSLEERVLKDRLDSSKGSDDVDSVVVELPELSVVPLGRPPERVVLEELVLLPVDPDSPSLVIRERVSVLLEERVDSGDSSIPRVLEILEREPSVLSGGLLPLHRVLAPDPSRVLEFRLPGLEVSEQVGDELLLSRGHSGSEVGDAADVGLLGPSEVRLRDQDVTHGQHTETTELLCK